MEASVTSRGMNYQILFIDVSQVYSFEEIMIGRFIHLFNSNIDLKYFRNRSIRLSKYTVLLFTPENDELQFWNLRDNLLSESKEEFKIKTKQMDSLPEEFDSRVNYILLTISECEAGKYLKQYSKELEYIKELLESKKCFKKEEEEEQEMMADVKARVKRITEKKKLLKEIEAKNYAKNETQQEVLTKLEKYTKKKNVFWEKKKIVLISIYAVSFILITEYFLLYNGAMINPNSTIIGYLSFLLLIVVSAFVGMIPCLGIGLVAAYLLKLFENDDINIANKKEIILFLFCLGFITIAVALIIALDAAKIWM